MRKTDEIHWFGRRIAPGEDIERFWGYGTFAGIPHSFWRIGGDWMVKPVASYSHKSHWSQSEGNSFGENGIDGKVAEKLAKGYVPGRPSRSERGGIRRAFALCHFVGAVHTGKWSKRA